MKRDQEQSKLNFTNADNISDPLTSLLNKKPTSSSASSAPSRATKERGKNHHDPLFSELYVVPETHSKNQSPTGFKNEKLEKEFTPPIKSSQKNQTYLWPQNNNTAKFDQTLNQHPPCFFEDVISDLTTTEFGIHEGNQKKIHNETLPSSQDVNKNEEQEEEEEEEYYSPRKRLDEWNLGHHRKNNFFCETSTTRNNSRYSVGEESALVDKPVVLLEHVKLNNNKSGSPKLHQQQQFSRRGPNSSFAVFTQSVLGHARGLQALARTAATTWLNQAPLTASNLLWDEAENITANLNSSNQQGWTPPPFKYRDVSNNNSSALSADSEVCVGNEEQYQQLSEETAAVFDPRLPFFGWFQNAWRKTLGLTYYEEATNFLCRVIKCGYCCLVFCLIHAPKTEPQRISYYWRPILPEKYILERPPPSTTATTRHSSLYEENSNMNGALLRSTGDGCEKVFTLTNNHKILLYPLETVRKSLTTWVLWNNYPPILGTLICTNFRIIFFMATEKLSFELVLGTQWMLFTNFWDIPISCIDRLTQVPLTTQEREFFSSMMLEPISSSTLLSDSDQRNAQFNVGGQRLMTTPVSQRQEFKNCVQVETKDNRKFRMVTIDRKHRDLATTFFFQSLLQTSGLHTLETKLITVSSPNNHTKTRPFYNSVEEWQRLLIHTQDWLRMSSVNSAYTVCSTYPKLVVIPKQLSDEQLIKVGSFRTKQRFPILSWAGPPLFGTLWRSSQPKSMFNRCWEDEYYLSLIAESSQSNFNSRKSGKTQNNSLMLILDARPLFNAMANKAAGAGFENTAVHYKFCRIEFANINNIHHVRDAWRKMASAVSSIQTNSIILTNSYYSFLNKKNYSRFYETNTYEACPNCAEHFSWSNSEQLTPQSSVNTLCLNPSLPLWSYSEPLPPLSVSSFTNSSASFQLLSQSQWYTYIQYILRATGLIVSRLTQGEPVLVHCSDGWDRTAQLTSLAMLCIDPYYRSTRGFCILVEQEFLHAGHPFHSRCGHRENITCPNPRVVRSAQDDGKLTEKSLYYQEGKKQNESLQSLGAYDLAVISNENPKNKKSDENSMHRNVHGNSDYSPIFIQWLDCVGQLLNQFPNAFEFDLRLINFLASQIYTCFYGTFLMNCPKERETMQQIANEQPLCIWNHILKHTEYFRASHQKFEAEPSVFSPSLLPDPMNIQIWNTYWFRYQPQGLQHLLHASV